MIKTKNKSSGLDKTFSDPKVRAELVEMLYNSLTNNVSKVSAQEYFAKIDLTGNFLHDIEGFANGLKEAVSAILDNHPNDSENSCDSDLMRILDLCDALVTGANISSQYLESLKDFGNDLNTIKSELHNCLVNIHREL